MSRCLDDISVRKIDTSFHFNRGPRIILARAISDIGIFPTKALQWPVLTELAYH